MNGMIHDILSTIRKDFFSQASYKTDFFFGFVSIFVSFFIAYFMTKIVSPEMFGDLGYLFFSIIGGINYAMVNSVIYQGAGTITSGRNNGTLMPTLLAYGHTTRVVVCASFYPLLHGLVAMYMQLFLLKFFVPQMHLSFFPAAAVIIVFPSLIGISMISVALTLIFKKNLFTYVLSIVGFLLTGVSYPVSILHIYLQRLAMLLPLTHMNNLIRAYLTQEPFIHSLYFLIGLSIIYVILGYILLVFAEEWTKKRGELFNW